MTMTPNTVICFCYCRKKNKTLRCYWKKWKIIVKKW